MVPDLLHCEETCTSFCRVFEDNDNADFWLACPSSTDEYPFCDADSMSHRERACIQRVINYVVRPEQLQTDNIFESVLGIPLWNALIQSALRRALATKQCFRTSSSPT
jgi:hypothetical protein